MLISQLRNPFFFRLFLLRYLPMALIAGLRLRKWDQEKAVVSVPFNYLTKNPFRSMYFAVQSMAAEFSTGILLVQQIEDSGADLASTIVSMEANFERRARSRTYFTCEVPSNLKELVEQAIETGEARQIDFHSTAKTSSGEELARFRFTWSVKKRS